MCREEFRLRNFKLWHPELREFTDSRLVPLPVFVAFRLFSVAYNLAWFIYNIFKFRAKLFIFLTNWSYTVLNVYFVLAATLSCIALYHDVKSRGQVTSPKTGTDPGPSVEIEMRSGDEDENRTEAREQDALRKHHKVLWLFHAISANAALLVTSAYWAILFENDPVDANNVTKHALNSVFMLADTFLSAMPVRLFHFVYPMLYMVVYLAFTVVYWVLDGTNDEGEPFIYSLLDYNNFQASTGCLIAFFLVLVLPVLQLILFGLTKLRDYLGRRRMDG